MNTKTYVQDLIKAGPDSFLNLFEVSFDFNGTDNPHNITYRTTTFSAPDKSISTADISYMNISFPIITSGVTLTKELTFKVRMDADYNLVKFLRTKLCFNDMGEYKRDSSKCCEITVKCYKPVAEYSDASNMEEVYSYKFRNCYLIQCPSISYDMGSPSAIEQNIRFIYSTMEESSAEESQSL